MTVAYILFVILTTVVSNPVLKYSFCPQWSPQCEATNFASSSTFEFGNISTGVYYFDPSQLIRPLSISCTSHEPLRWVLSANQDVEVNSIWSNLTQNGSQLLYFYHINLNEASPGLIRCESYEDTDSAAEIYIAAHGLNQVYYQPDTSIQRFSPSVRKRGGQLIIPCNLIAFDRKLIHADTTNWLKIVEQSVMLPRFASENCSSCYDQMLPQANNCTPKCQNMDCNGDGQVTCSDHFSAMLSFPNKCENDENVGSNFRQIEACVTKEFRREVNLTELDYDPRMGFRLRTVVDLDKVYVCGSSHEVIYLMPYNPQKRIQASLQVNDPTTSGVPAGISCTCPQQRMEQDVHLQLLPCSTLFECETQLQTIEDRVVFRTSNYKIVNSSESISKLTSRSFGRVIRKPGRSGVVTCAASYQYDIGYIWDIKFFFTGLDSKIYFTTDVVPTEAVMSLKKLRTNFNKTTNRFEISVECTVETFIVFPNLEFFAQYRNETTSKIEGDTVFKKSESLSPEKSHFVSLISISTNSENTIEAISCQAHFRNSMRRLEVTLAVVSVETEPTANNFVSPTDGTSSSVYIVVIPTLGCVILVAGSIALGLYTVRKDGQAKKWRQLTIDEANEFLSGKSAAIPTIGTNNEINIDGIGFPKSYQIIPVDLKMNNHELLGEGHFGRCVKGQFRNIEVAVKTLKGTSDVNTFKEFLREVKIMAYIGQHANVVQFLGAVVNQLRERVCFAVVELSPYGDLFKYLRKNDPESSKGNQYSNIFHPEANSKMALGMDDLVHFCEQIAAGMEFLGSKNVIHGDLAARNVLVYKDNVVKITDFGLSRKLYNASNYQKTSATPLPWAWMALESLKYMEFSPMTDMWSYGVTVWEIFTFGQVPFAGFSYSCEFISDMDGGRRLPCPKLAPEVIYQFMRQMLDRNSSFRPSFEDAKLFFRQNSARAEQGLLVKAQP